MENNTNKFEQDILAYLDTQEQELLNLLTKIRTAKEAITGTPKALTTATTIRHESAVKTPEITPKKITTRAYVKKKVLAPKQITGGHVKDKKSKNNLKTSEVSNWPTMISETLRQFNEPMNLSELVEKLIQKYPSVKTMNKRSLSTRVSASLSANIKKGRKLFTRFENPSNSKNNLYFLEGVKSNIQMND